MSGWRRIVLHATASSGCLGMDGVCSMGCRACIHIYFMVQSIRRYLFPSFWSSVTRTKSSTHTTTQRKSLRKCRIELDRRSHHYPPRGKGVDAVLQYFDDELLLCSSARLSFVWIVRKTTADHAGSCGDICIGKWLFRRLCRWGNSNVTYIFFFTNTEMSLG